MRAGVRGPGGFAKEFDLSCAGSGKIWFFWRIALAVMGWRRKKRSRGPRRLLQRWRDLRLRECDRIWKGREIFKKFQLKIDGNWKSMGCGKDRQVEDDLIPSSSREREWPRL